MVVSDKMVEKHVKVLRMQHIQMRAQNKHSSPKAGSRGSSRSGTPRSASSRTPSPKRSRRKSTAVSSMLSFPSMSIDPSLYFMYEQEAKREYPDIPSSIKRTVIKDFLLDQATHYQKVVLVQWRSGKTRFKSFGSDLQKQMLEDAKSFLKRKDDGDAEDQKRRGSVLTLHEKRLRRPKFDRKLGPSSIKRCIEICYERLGRLRQAKGAKESSSSSSSSGSSSSTPSKKGGKLNAIRRSLTAGAALKNSSGRGRRRSMSGESKNRRASSSQADSVRANKRAKMLRGRGLAVVTEGH